MQPTTITGVRTIGVKVSDQDAATEFYVGALGFEKRLDAPMSPTMHWIEVAPRGANTSIALNLNDEVKQIITSSWMAGWSVKIPAPPKVDYGTSKIDRK